MCIRDRSNLGLQAFRQRTRRAAQAGSARSQFQPVGLARSILIDALARIDVEIGHLVHVEGEFHLLSRLHRGFCLQTDVKHFLLTWASAGILRKVPVIVLWTLAQREGL